jgi:hypothetical protein
MRSTQSWTRSIGRAKVSERHARAAGETAALAQKLQVVPQVHALDATDEPGGWGLAYSLMEIDESLSRFRELLARVKADNLDAGELHGLLIDIGEELRHVLYHVKDSQFYGYLETPK